VVQSAKNCGKPELGRGQQGQRRSGLLVEQAWRHQAVFERHSGEGRSDIRSTRGLMVHCEVAFASRGLQDTGCEVQRAVGELIVSRDFIVEGAYSRRSKMVTMRANKSGAPIQVRVPHHTPTGVPLHHASPTSRVA
jgi:hypothetical protein